MSVVQGAAFADFEGTRYLGSDRPTRIRNRYSGNRKQTFTSGRPQACNSTIFKVVQIAETGNGGSAVTDNLTAGEAGLLIRMSRSSRKHMRIDRFSFFSSTRLSAEERTNTMYWRAKKGKF